MDLALPDCVVGRSGLSRVPWLAASAGNSAAHRQVECRENRAIGEAADGCWAARRRSCERSRGVDNSVHIARQGGIPGPSRKGRNTMIAGAVLRSRCPDSRRIRAPVESRKALGEHRTRGPRSHSIPGSSGEAVRGSSWSTKNVLACGFLSRHGDTGKASSPGPPDNHSPHASTARSCSFPSVMGRGRRSIEKTNVVSRQLYFVKLQSGSIINR